jgi:hypothetical protein
MNETPSHFLPRGPNLHPRRRRDDDHLLSTGWLRCFVDGLDTSQNHAPEALFFPLLILLELLALSAEVEASEHGKFQDRVSTLEGAIIDAVAARAATFPVVHLSDAHRGGYGRWLIQYNV